MQNGKIENVTIFMNLKFFADTNTRMEESVEQPFLL